MLTSSFFLYSIVFLIFLIVIIRVIYCIGYTHGYNDGANVQHWYETDKKKFWDVFST